MSRDFLSSWGLGRIYRAWALAAQGREAAGISQIQEGLAALQDTGSQLDHSEYLGVLAEAYGKDQQVEEGLGTVAEGLAFVERTEERFCEAEVHRLKGELLLQQSPDNHQDAEACFQKAIDSARQQGAKSWELRAATSLARLWQSQGKQTEACDLLAPVYNWFTEGFDTADLKDAKALLEALS